MKNIFHIILRSIINFQYDPSYSIKMNNNSILFVDSKRYVEYPHLTTRILFKMAKSYVIISESILRGTKEMSGISRVPVPEFKKRLSGGSVRRNVEVRWNDELWIVTNDSGNYFPNRIYRYGDLDCKMHRTFLRLLQFIKKTSYELSCISEILLNFHCNYGDSSVIYRTLCILYFMQMEN